MPDPDEVPADREPPEGRQTAAGLVAGAAGAGVALGFGELIEGTSETIPSLVIAVGEVVTDYTPGEVVAFSIANIGASQKTVLTVGIVVLSLGVCGLLGRAAARGRRSVAVGGFALFGLVGGWAAARNPLSPAVESWIVALVAATVGAATTLLLVNRAAAARRRAADVSEETEGTGADGARRSRPRVGTRRSFFAYASGAGVTAISMVGIGRSLRGESAAEKARETFTLPSRTNSGLTDESGTAGAAPESQTTAEDPAVSVEPLETAQQATELQQAGPGTTQPAGEQPAVDGAQPDPAAAATEQPAPTDPQQEPDAAEFAAQPEEATPTTQPATESEDPGPTTSQAAQPEEATPTTQPPEEPEEATPTPSRLKNPRNPHPQPSHLKNPRNPHPQPSHPSTCP